MKTVNWNEKIDLAGKCGSCKHYKSFIKPPLTARGKCLLVNKYKQRTDGCLKYVGEF